jgi:non-canonical purine NTP pyrophosphatase (RdgB/HAM1 family)
MEVYFATGNPLKFSIASNILGSYGIKVLQEKIETPEIQSENGKEICEYSAKYASQKLKKPVIKTDVSYHIPALNGFPGPYIKYINKWLKAEDILKLLTDKKDRTIEIREYLSYAENQNNVVTFETLSKCRLSDKVYSNKGSPIDQLLIRPGFDVPQNMLDSKKLQEVFSKEVKVWHDLGNYLKGKYSL